MDYNFEWQRILLNDLPFAFLFEVVLRSIIMFITLLIVLKLTGKRGVKQLSVFEMAIIISLGSAAGDPMFYEEVGLLPAIVVLIVVVLLYRLVTWLIGKNVWIERLIKGNTECLIEEGKFNYTKLNKESMALDEFFSELRLKSIEHLGQIKNAYFETSGDISIYYYEDKDIKPGLPITPNLFKTKTDTILTEGFYACSICGDTKQQTQGKAICKVCENDKWVKAIDTKRIT